MTSLVSMNGPSVTDGRRTSWPDADSLRRRLELVHGHDRRTGLVNQRLVSRGVLVLPLHGRISPRLLVAVDEDQELRHLTSDRSGPGGPLDPLDELTLPVSTIGSWTISVAVDTVRDVLDGRGPSRPHSEGAWIPGLASVPTYPKRRILSVPLDGRAC